MSKLGGSADGGSWTTISEIQWLKNVLKGKDTPAEALAWLKKYNRSLDKRTEWGKINAQSVTEYVEKEYARLKKEVEDEH